MKDSSEYDNVVITRKDGSKSIGIGPSEILSIIEQWGIANETSVDYTYYDGLLYLGELQTFIKSLRMNPSQVIEAGILNGWLKL